MLRASRQQSQQLLGAAVRDSGQRRPSEAAHLRAARTHPSDQAMQRSGGGQTPRLSPSSVLPQWLQCTEGQRSSPWQPAWRREGTAAPGPPSGNAATSLKFLCCRKPPVPAHSQVGIPPSCPHSEAWWLPKQLTRTPGCKAAPGVPQSTFKSCARRFYELCLARWYRTDLGVLGLPSASDWSKATGSLASGGVGGGLY